MPIADPALPEVEVLLGSEAGDLLASYAAAAGEEVVAWRLRQAVYEPGAALTTRYDVDVRNHAGETHTWVVMAACGAARHDGTTLLEADGLHVGCWTFPHDPSLPGLAAALDPRSVRALLAGVGAPTAAVRLRTRVYRPGRRAVVEVSSGGARLYLKVVPPAEVERLHDAYRVLATAGTPSPPSHGWSPDLGIVALGALPGRNLRDALRAGEGPFPGASEIDQILDGLPHGGRERRRR